MYTTLKTKLISSSVGLDAAKPEYLFVELFGGYLPKTLVAVMHRPHRVGIIAEFMNECAQI